VQPRPVTVGCGWENCHFCNRPQSRLCAGDLALL
jgi:hypothetical protein